ncbi:MULTISPECIES: hypothetical protein [unclassified Serratia (in: enterobacteria)]|uniref:hypothetical protein n=1 Tax=unclassified Serratia (in: enterobacteria) TaxID=2647522 RepID=UPI000505C3C6|nr:MULTISPECIES: hypothetical protein [unclassified Serratia (in: enterobacteria)]KFK94559.1 hypothetical protein JV45_11570 [Serratia sp. Ag2]KFK95779.1 hypothetical protein IV04_20345 [Serratia sp. Ag1]
MSNANRHLYSVPSSSDSIATTTGNSHTPSYGDGNGGGDDMLSRIKKLEDDVQSMKTDVAVIRSNYATKSDVSDAKTSIILWVVGAVVFAQLIPAIPAIIKAFTQ